MIEIDYQLSQVGRGLKYSMDPLLLLKEPAAPQAGGFVKSAGNAMVVGKDGSGEMLEIGGEAFTVVMEYVRALRELGMESVHGIPVCSLAAEIQAFKPGNPTVLVAATTTAASVASPGSGGSLLVFNSCAVPARIDFTGNAATTPVAGTPGSPGIPPTTLVVLEIGTGATSASVKVDSGTACNVELTRGEGMAH
jgi:hypothetical protein